MSDFKKLRRYIALPFRSADRIQRDVDDELGLHIEMRTDELMKRGLSRVDARDQALRDFGDVEDARRFCSNVDAEAQRRHTRAGWIAEIGQDARLALRMLRRAPAFAAATIITLAIAIGASTTVYSVLHAYLIRPLPFPEPHRLMSVIAGPSLDVFPNAPSLRQVDWKRADSLFEATATWDLDGFTIPGAEHAEYVGGAWVSEGFFQALGLNPAIGRGFRKDEYATKAPVAIISHDFWVRRFNADPHVIGTTITTHSTDRPREPTLVTIVGVSPEAFWSINRFNDLLRPLPLAESRVPYLARLKKGATIAETQSRLDAVVRAQLSGEIDPKWHMTIMSTQAEHVANVRPALVVVLGAALFMLLAACGSVAGALVSRMASRRGELAVRMALGGSGGRITRQLLTESAVLATIAGLVGIALAYLLLDVGGSLIEQQLATATPGGVGGLRPDIGIMALAVVVSSIVGIAMGLVPSLTFSIVRGTPGASLLGSARGHSGRPVGTRVRRLLIAGQIAVAMVLLFGAGLMLQTVRGMASTDLGFRAEGVLKGIMLLPRTRYPDSTSQRLVVERILGVAQETPGVRSAAVAVPYPFRGTFQSPVSTEGSSLNERSRPIAAVYTVSAGYFETMEMRVLRGRGIQRIDDERAPPVVVVSDGLARRLSPNGDIIGRRIRMGDDENPWRTVIGIVNETRESFTADAMPDVFVPYAQSPSAFLSIVVRTDRDEATLIEPIKRAVASVDAVLAMSEVESMTAVVARQTSSRRGMTALLGVFSVLALGLSVLGLYASLSYMVVQRRPELAVRLAVGADARAILRLVVGEGLLTAAFGVVTGAAASLLLGRILQNQVYGVSTTDPLTLAVIALTLGVATIAACAVPGLRAARTDAALALRE